ncbi:MAG: hypothetical protein JWP57_4374 [Spirosoma sp.]|nr:hypothetical protein [Spirosoma sp.]
MRLVKDGPKVAARIWQDDNGLWRAEINGEVQEPAGADPYRARGVLRIWHSGRRCTEGEYRYRLELKAWALANNPDHPAANPSRPISLKRMPPIF